MAGKIQAVRGMNDITPEESPYWQRVETLCRQIAAQYSYQEIRFPIVEQTALFKRSIGEATDIVEKEMYTFEDRNGDSLSLRPEGTASCVRAGIEQGLLYNQIRRLWYMGPMFRHERPQKGRYRQFFQFGIEAFGMSGPDIDAEQILMMQRFWQELGIADQVSLQINTLGSSDNRKAYREALVTYLQQYVDQLDEDSQRRLTTNPLRILDSKNPQVQEIVKNAPKMIDYLDEEAQAHYTGFKQILDANGIQYTENPTLVRGLDYYCYTVYEWVTDALGAQGTVCAGGRYDRLVEMHGGKATPAVGFAMGLERLILLLQQKEQVDAHPDVYWVLVGDAATVRGMQYAEQLRTAIPGLSIETNLAGGGFKGQFKRADKSGARWALIIADDELTRDVITVKDLRQGTEQQTLSFDDVVKFLMNVARSEA